MGNERERSRGISFLDEQLGTPSAEQIREIIREEVNAALARGDTRVQVEITHDQAVEAVYAALNAATYNRQERPYCIISGIRKVALESKYTVRGMQSVVAEMQNRIDAIEKTKAEQLAVTCKLFRRTCLYLLGIFAVNAAVALYRIFQ